MSDLQSTNILGKLRNLYYLLLTTTTFLWGFVIIDMNREGFANKGMDKLEIPESFGEHKKEIPQTFITSKIQEECWNKQLPLWCNFLRKILNWNVQ